MRIAYYCIETNRVHIKFLSWVFIEAKLLPCFSETENDGTAWNGFKQHNYYYLKHEEGREKKIYENKTKNWYWVLLKYVHGAMPGHIIWICNECCSAHSGKTYDFFLLLLQTNSSLTNNFVCTMWIGDRWDADRLLTLADATENETVSIELNANICKILFFYVSPSIE